ncbi:MAG: polymer-forming cytoskeletal protein [Verrucomicrobiota bacterium]
MTATKNILSSDVEIKGSLKFSNDLVIDGVIEGEIISDGNLTVGENADVKGEIKVKSVSVFGKVEGNVTVTDRCELKSNSELNGDVQASVLSIEEGAAFTGRSTVGAAAKKAAAAASSSAPKPVGSAS